jgi:4-amino-4-deoxy-L-arabinose transferase-like glycosyltransferase
VRQAWFLANDALPEPLRTVGPLYPLVLTVFWFGFPGRPDPVDPGAVPAGLLVGVHVLQAILGTLTVALVYRLARRLIADRRSALFAAVGVGVSPAFVIEPLLVHTESLFIALLVAAVLLQVRNGRLAPGASAVVGVVTALAALTRPMLLLFPLVLAAQLMLTRRSTQSVRAAAALLLAALITLAPWNFWLYRTTGSWLPAGFASNLWIGTQRDGGPLEVKTFHQLGDQLEASGRGYLGGALDEIAARPGEWIARRGRNVAGAILQPHGTSDLGGPSTKAAVLQWWREDRSSRGFLRVASAPTFWLRAIVYIFHYAALALGVIGIWKTLPVWRDWTPVYAAILYVLLVHALLTANSRYLFPTEPFWWVLAGAAVAPRTAVTTGAAPRSG